MLYCFAGKLVIDEVIHAAVRCPYGFFFIGPPGAAIVRPRCEHLTLQENADMSGGVYGGGNYLSIMPSSRVVTLRLFVKFVSNV